MIFVSDTGGVAARPTLAQKINRLFDLHPRGQGPQSNDEVAAAISARGGATISPAYLYLLRSGKRDNPTARHLEALAQHFGVPPGYFLNDTEAETIAKELELLLAMRDAGVKQVALRASGLSAESLEAVAMLLTRLRKGEGLPDPTEPDEDEGK